MEAHAHVVARGGERRPGRESGDEKDEEREDGAPHRRAPS
jgi:hypothetical protein